MQLQKLVLFLVAAVAAGLATSCSDPASSATPTDFLTEGTWGGDDAGVIVTEERTHVHIGCTFGDMPAKVPLDDEGRFTIDGTYVLRAYPVQLGPSLPAQFAGLVQGEDLTLAIAVDDTVEKKVVALGPVTVTYGREPKMAICPICAISPQGAASR